MMTLKILLRIYATIYVCLTMFGCLTDNSLNMNDKLKFFCLLIPVALYCILP